MDTPACSADPPASSTSTAGALELAAQPGDAGLPRLRPELRRALVVLVAALAVLVGALASMSLGAVHLPLHSVIDAITGSAHAGPTRQIVLQLRLPRTVDALLVGAALGIAGALLQGALGNPLASPDVIGVTGGSGFGALLILLVFPGSLALLPLGALVCGMLAAGMVMIVAWSGPGAGGIGRIILSGIAVSALFTAGTTSLLSAFPNRVQSAVFFLVGGLTSDGWSDARAVWPYLVVGFLAAALLARPLDRLALGDDVAASLGTRPRLIRLASMTAAALLAASAAAIAGLLGFLGLVIPHVVRLAAGTSNNRYVVPVSGLAGAGLLVIGDTLARTVDAPIELPVGPLMVALGVPLFLYLLRNAT